MKIIPKTKDPKIGDVYYVKHGNFSLWEDGEYQINQLKSVEDWAEDNRIGVEVDAILFEPQFKGEYGFWSTIENFQISLNEKRYKFLRHEKIIKKFNKV